MEREIINAAKQAEMATQLPCEFRADGECAEMSMELSGYAEQTLPIEDVEFGFWHGDLAAVHAAVAQVEEDWVRYFTADSPVFCATVAGEIVSFCMVGLDVDCMISRPGERVASIGCVGTVPAWRRRGIGLRMVDLATLWAAAQGQTRGYIHYTAVDPWYARLGYRVFARFSLLEG